MAQAGLVSSLHLNAKHKDPKFDIKNKLGFSLKRVTTHIVFNFRKWYKNHTNLSLSASLFPKAHNVA